MYNRSNPRVLVMMGSDSDLPVMTNCLNTLDQFSVEYDVIVCSAHRTPDQCAALAREAADRGISVIIAAAGGAAHLAGVIAAHTILPVIAVPIASTPLAGFDSLLSMVQMPPGIPVATVAVGEFGATNAAILAAQIIALGDPIMKQRLLQQKSDMATKVQEKNAKLAASLLHKQQGRQATP
jgi:phosphoribosylaminoimidazole carboxylase PurE protein